MRRFRPRRCVRGLWEGLVAYGRLCLAGARRTGTTTLRARASGGTGRRRDTRNGCATTCL
ncbi:hypothetical protein SUDANB135_00002 [Streptomyces sp. SudanB135_2055]